MIEFNYQIEFDLPQPKVYAKWITSVIEQESCIEGDISYVFCSDEYLLELNKKFLNHDTLTDIISFDYSVGKELHGDIYISIERVEENAQIFGVSFVNELARVMVHGVLHYAGYKDKLVDEKEKMRAKENYYLSQLHN